jgi:uncharacterized protein (TIGR03000 family)
MYSMVLMAALATGVDMPDLGRRGGCHGCWGCYGCYGCRGGCWGCWGGCWGCWGGCYGCWGGCYGYGGYALGGYAPVTGSYVYAPTMPEGAAVAATFPNAERTQSFYYSPAAANEATLIVHLPESASLSIDGQPTQQGSGTRVFTSPPLEPGKTYVYTLTAEMRRDGHVIRATKNVEVRAGQRSEVTMDFAKPQRREERERER